MIKVYTETLNKAFRCIIEHSLAGKQVFDRFGWHRSAATASRRALPDLNKILEKALAKGDVVKIEIDTGE